MILKNRENRRHSAIHSLLLANIFCRANRGFFRAFCHISGKRPTQNTTTEHLLNTWMQKLYTQFWKPAPYLPY